jgi:excisionase family DNA binding protein
MAVQCPFCGHETDFMTSGQVAQLLGISKETVLRYVKAGRFPGTTKETTGVQPETYRIPASAVLPLAQERQEARQRAVGVL